MVYTIHKSYVTHHNTGGIAVIQATSCGGVVIFRGKILVLYKNFKNKYEGWPFRSSANGQPDYKRN